MIGFVVVGIILLLLFLVRPFTVIIHELGHAIPALLLTEEQVEVYIGSYGEPNQAFHLSIRKLSIFFKYSPFLWEVGLCRHSGKGLNFFKELIIILGGPLTSLVIGFSAFYFAVDYDIHGILKTLSFVIMLSAIFDFVTNLYPNKQPINIYGRGIAYNDGESLRRLFKLGPFLKAFYKAEDFFIRNDYKAANEIYLKIIEAGVAEQYVFQQSIYALFSLNEFKEASRIQKIHEEKGDLINEDYYMMGLVYARILEYDKAITYYQKALVLKPRSYLTLNNIGYTYNLMEQYEKSIDYLNKAIMENPHYAFAYNNRGLARIKTGLLEEGLKDIKKSLELDEKNAYAWRNLGIYFLETKDAKTAYKHFQKAENLESGIPLLDNLLNQTKPQ